MNNLHDFTINLYFDGMNIVYLSPQNKHQSITVKMLTYGIVLRCYVLKNTVWFCHS